MEWYVGMTSTSRLQMMQRCRECLTDTLVTDYRQGEVLCNQCGLVHEQRILDDRPEWNNYPRDDEQGPSHASSSRVGAPIDPLMPTASTMTMIAKTSNSHPLNVLHTRNAMSYEDRSNFYIFHEIETVLETMFLPKTVLDFSKEMYVDAKKHHIFRGDNHKAIVACCVFFACKRAKGCFRQVLEICKAFGVEETKFHAATDMLLTNVKDKYYYRDLVDDEQCAVRGMILRCVDMLSLERAQKWKLVRFVEDAYTSIRHNKHLQAKLPKSIVAGLIKVAVKKHQVKVSDKQIASNECCDVSMSTLKQVYTTINAVMEGTLV